MMAGLGDRSLVLTETENQSTWTSQHSELWGKTGGIVTGCLAEMTTRLLPFF